MLIQNADKFLYTTKIIPLGEIWLEIFELKKSNQPINGRFRY